MMTQIFASDGLSRDRRFYGLPTRLTFNSKYYNRRIIRNGYFPSLENKFFDDEFTIEFIDNIDQKCFIYFKGCFFKHLNLNLTENKNLEISFEDCYFEYFTCSSNKLKLITFKNCLGNINNHLTTSLKFSFDIGGLRYEHWKRIFVRILRKKTQWNVSINCTDIPTLIISGYLNSSEFLDASATKVIFDENKHTRINRVFLGKELLKRIKIDLRLRFFNLESHKILRIQEIDLNFLNIYGKTNNRIRFEDFRVKTFHINKFNSTNETNFFGIKPLDNSSSIKIEESNLNNVWFDNVNFKDFLNVSFYRSSFFNTRFTSVIFPKKFGDHKNFRSLPMIEYPNLKRESFYRDQYDTFLQLKSALEKSGNTYEAQKMKGWALRNLEKVDDLRFFQDIIPLKLNKWSSDHGISPIKTLIWILVFSHLIYFLLLLSFKQIEFAPNNEYWYKPIISNLRYYFVILNPVHKVNDLIPYGEKNANSIYVISFFSRIIIGYLYYQFIAAFRRFGKT